MSAGDAPRPVRPLSTSRSRKSLSSVAQSNRGEEAESWRQQSMQPSSRQPDSDDEHLLLHRTVLASKKQQVEHQHERLAKQRAFIRHEKRKLLLQNALLESERERFTASLASDWFCTSAFPTSSSRDNGRRVALDVGGQLFEISRAAAAKDPSSLLAAFVSDDSPLATNERGCFRVDRDWWLFRYVLRFLRDGVLPSEPKLLRELYLESEFWRFESLRKAIEARNMELLARRQAGSDAIAAAALLASATASEDASRRRESGAAKPKAVTPRDPSAWWQEPPEWWGAPVKQEPAPATKEEIAVTAQPKEDPDAWWKTATYKGTDYWNLLSKSSGARGADSSSSERPLSAASGTPRSPMVAHSTWPSIAN